MTHDELCIVAGKWMKRNKFRMPVITDQMTYHYNFKANSVTINNRLSYLSENPDVIGFNAMVTDSVIIEVKMSRPDFKRDGKKMFRANPQMGMGKFRYYCCPEGLIYADELPDNWGLLYYRDGKISESVTATEFEKVNRWAERYMMLYYLRFPKKYAENKI